MTLFASSIRSKFTAGIIRFFPKNFLSSFLLCGSASNEIYQLLLPEKVCSLFSFLKNIFSDYRILYWQSISFFPFSTSKVSFLVFWFAQLVTISVWYCYLSFSNIECLFSLDAFNSFIIGFQQLNHDMPLVFFIFVLLGIYWGSWVYELTFFLKYGKVLPIVL